MQKVYQRINWENDPSTNTPINEDNLNKMDYALYELDKRVLTLGGYEERAALSATNAETSEINAKTSENNSKVSETNAKTSEINAKDYMERAYAATPEGYDELVETVRLMDIATTTESILEKSKPGGLKINHIKGATEQNGTPTPSSPIGIKNVGDCVEIIQGGYANGVYTNIAVSVCNKNKIPCKSGDVVKVETENPYNIAIFWYDEKHNFISYKSVNGAKINEVTIADGGVFFAFHIQNANGLTPQTVGKISITVNGKYVTQFKTVGKNFSKRTTISGTASVSYEVDIPSGDYAISAKITTTDTDSGISLLIVQYEDSSTEALYFTRNEKRSLAKTFSKRVIKIVVYASSDYSKSEGDTFTWEDIQIEKGSTVTDFEPYHESTATILTDEPIREGDIVFKDNGVWNVERNSGYEKLIGAETEGWIRQVTSTSGKYRFHRLLKATSTSDYTSVLCNRLKGVSGDANYTCAEGISIGSTYIYVYIENISAYTLEEFLTWLSSNPIEIEYKLATPTYETLDTASQLALNSLETFDTVTYIEVDSRVQPSEIEVEYGTSQVGAYTLKSLLNSESNALRYEQLTTALLELSQE